MECMLLGYTQDHMDSTHHMLNICMSLIVLSRDIIWLNKTYGKYISWWEHTKAGSYILKDEYESNKRAHVKKYPVKNENIVHVPRIHTRPYG